MEEIKEVSPRNNEEEKEETDPINMTNTPAADDFTNTYQDNSNNKQEENKKNNKENQEVESEDTMQMDQDLSENVENLNFNFENDLKEYLQKTPFEDIDIYINNIQNRFNKSKMMRLNTQKKDFNNQFSEKTVEKERLITNNVNNIIFEDICNF